MRNERIARLFWPVMTSTSSSTSTNGSRSPRSAARRGRTTSSILGDRRDSSSRSSSRRRSRALEGRRDPGEQHDGIVVAAAELHPAAGPRVRVAPLRGKRRFPVARRARRPAPPGCAARPAAGTRGGPAAAHRAEPPVPAPPTRAVRQELAGAGVAMARPTRTRGIAPRAAARRDADRRRKALPARPSAVRSRSRRRSARDTAAARISASLAEVRSAGASVGL